MIYHSFPRVSQEDRFTRAEILDTNGLPAIQDVLLRLPAKTPTRGLSLNNPYGDPVFSIGGRQSIEIYADTNVVAPLLTTLSAKTGLFAGVLTERLPGWIPYTPSTSGYPRPLQAGISHLQVLLRRSGKIPALRLFPNCRHLAVHQLQQSFLGMVRGHSPLGVFHRYPEVNQNLWTQFMYWACYLGMFMCFTGFVLGIRSYWLARRKGFLRSPYKKRWFKWHHITGFFFGIFIFTWILSGYMSMAPPFVAFQQTGLQRIPPKPSRKTSPITCQLCLGLSKSHRTHSHAG